MVTQVFSLPSYDLVSKVIRDRFSAPKTTSRKLMMQTYHLVFRHDRAGRLVDALEFEHLEFDRDRYAPELPEELLRTAGACVNAADCRVIVEHAYIERCATPMGVYRRGVNTGAAQAAA